MERKIISAIVGSREIWEKVHPHLKDKEFSPEGALLFKLIGDYYGADSQARSVDIEILSNRVERSISSPKLARLVTSSLGGLPEVSGANIAGEVLALKAHNIGLQLSSLLAAGKAGSEVRGLMDEYRALSERSSLEGDVDDEVGSFAVHDLVTTHFNKEKLIQLWPKILNDHLDGGARRGHNVLVFAPTEMGKTLFVINLMAGFTKQGLKTLYVGNEDPIADIQMRYVNRITGMNKYQVQENPDEAQKRCDARNYSLVTFAPLAPGNFRKIQELVAKWAADVVVIDQLRNIDVDSENRTQALEKAATEARNLGKRNDILVVSVSQAADSASGKRILNRGDVDSSNIGIPGPMDLMVGLGADEEMESRNIRVISFPKNKLSGKHEPLTVGIDPLLSRVIEAEVA